MDYHSGSRWQRGSEIGSLFSGIFHGLMPVARSAVKTIGRVARSAPIRSAGKALKKRGDKSGGRNRIIGFRGPTSGQKS